MSALQDLKQRSYDHILVLSKFEPALLITGGKIKATAHGGCDPAVGELEGVTTDLKGEDREETEVCEEEEEEAQTLLSQHIPRISEATAVSHVHVSVSRLKSSERKRTKQNSITAHRILQSKPRSLSC